MSLFSFGRPARIFHGGTQYVGVPITAENDDGTQFDVTVLPAFLAFLLPGAEPRADGSDWVPAVWHHRLDEYGQLVTFADVNIGPAAGAATDWPTQNGRTNVWWHLQVFPEDPQGLAGLVQLY